MQYAHTPFVLEALHELRERVFSLDGHSPIRRAFQYVHETLDKEIISICDQDINDMFWDNVNDKNLVSESNDIKNLTDSVNIFELK